MKLKKALYFFFIIIALLIFLLLMLNASSKIKLQTSAMPSKQQPHLIIDAGHGGEDGGAVSSDGVLEKGINLAISQDTRDLLTFFGFETEMTRTDDGALTMEGETVKARKYNDMKMRLDIFNSSENNIILSIHQNKFSNSASKGTQVFYSPNNEKSLKLADAIKFSVRSLLQPENERECKAADDSIYLLKNTQNPAVIVECGFLSNPDECGLLTTEEYQKKLAFSITTGFLDFFNTN